MSSPATVPAVGTYSSSVRNSRVSAARCSGVGLRQPRPTASCVIFWKSTYADLLVDQFLHPGRRRRSRWPCRRGSWSSTSAVRFAHQDIPSRRRCLCNERSPQHQCHRCHKRERRIFINFCMGLLLHWQGCLGLTTKGGRGFARSPIFLVSPGFASAGLAAPSPGWPGGFVCAGRMTSRLQTPVPSHRLTVILIFRIDHSGGLPSYTRAAAALQVAVANEAVAVERRLAHHRSAGSSSARSLDDPQAEHGVLDTRIVDVEVEIEERLETVDADGVCARCSGRRSASRDTARLKAPTPQRLSEILAMRFHTPAVARQNIQRCRPWC